jgi:WD domain, G-beta repeat
MSAPRQWGASTNAAPPVSSLVIRDDVNITSLACSSSAGAIHVVCAICEPDRFGDTPAGEGLWLRVLRRRAGEEAHEDGEEVDEFGVGKFYADVRRGKLGGPGDPLGESHSPDLGDVAGVAISPCGRFLALSSADRAAIVSLDRDVSKDDEIGLEGSVVSFSGEVLWEEKLQLQAERSHAVALSAESATGAVALLLHDGSSARLFSECVVRKGGGEGTGSDDSGEVIANSSSRAVSLSSDGSVGLAVHSSGLSAVLWQRNVDDLRELGRHDGGILDVALTPLGDRALSASTDQTIRLYDTLSGSCTAVLAGHSAPVCALAVSPDGGLAVSGGRDDRCVYVGCVFCVLILLV